MFRKGRTDADPERKGKREADKEYDRKFREGHGGYSRYQWRTMTDEQKAAILANGEGIDFEDRQAFLSALMGGAEPPPVKSRIDVFLEAFHALTGDEKKLARELL